MPLEGPPPNLWGTGWRAWIEDFLSRVVASEIPNGITWTSFFRTPEENRRVGGAQWSNHLVALGLDVAHHDLGELYRWASRARAQGLGAVVELGAAPGSENWPYDLAAAGHENRHLHLQRLSVGVLQRFGETGQWTQRT